MTSFEVTGTVGDSEVTITVEGPETPAQHVFTDLKARANELNQMVEHGVSPDAAVAPVAVDWEEVLEGHEAGDGS